MHNSQVHIILVFGKNEQNISKSFKMQDIEYFTKFPNITIVYITNLHAKYYGNEKKSIITSMNLIDYSLKNNIEFGVSSTKNVLLMNEFFENSKKKCFHIIENEGFTIFVKRPQYKKKLLGLGKDYVGSEIDLNLIEKISNGKEIEKRKLSEFSNEKYVNVEIKEARKEREHTTKVEKQAQYTSNASKNGNCIKCNTKIDLDLKKPLCWNCYKVWVECKEPYYPGKYCILCGDEKKSVNFSKPACYKCHKNIMTDSIYKNLYKPL